MIEDRSRQDFSAAKMLNRLKFAVLLGRRIIGMQSGGIFMNRYLMTLLAGVAIGAIALQGLHAQGAKQKAYTVSEIEVLDASALAAYLPAVRKATEVAHGRPLRTGGRVVQIEGGPAPKRVGITEWDSVDDAVAFYKSKAWTDLAPQRDKATKVVRRYVVETEK